ncbi:MAG: cation diffusion facilitator family transporter [Litorimonas sp.]
MSGCCDDKVFEGMSDGYKRALLAVILINAVMFCVEITAGLKSGSQALLADALDFAGDSATYTISLLVIGASLRTRAMASLFKGGSLAFIAIIILASSLYRFLGDTVPVAETMGIVGFLALLANLTSLLVLMRWRDGDSNVRSVWLCSRNDAIGNVGVIIAGIVVAITGTAWPDLVVAILLATLFLRSSFSIISQARAELKSGEVIRNDTC